MRTKDDFIRDAHRVFALAQPGRANPWTAMLPPEPRGAAYDSARGLRARDEDLEELARRLARDPRREDYENARELDDDDHKRLMEMVDREREAEDRRRGARDETEEERRERERIPASSITPMSREDERYLRRVEDRRPAHSFDAAVREVRATLPQLAMDSVSTIEGAYAAGAQALGFDTRGMPPSEWPRAFRAAVASAEESFHRMFGPTTRKVTPWPNDLSWGR